MVETVGFSVGLDHPVVVSRGGGLSRGVVSREVVGRGIGGVIGDTPSGSRRMPILPLTVVLRNCILGNSLNLK